MAAVDFGDVGAADEFVEVFCAVFRYALVCGVFFHRCSFLKFWGKGSVLGAGGNVIFCGLSRFFGGGPPA